MIEECDRKNCGLDRLCGISYNIDLNLGLSYALSMKQLCKIPCIDKYGELIMSLLEREVLLKGNRGQLSAVALFDSGASYSCIRRDVAESIGVLDPLDEPLEFSTADEGTVIRAELSIRLSFFFPDTDRRFTDEFIVLDTLSEPLIIGAKTMQAWRIRLDFENEEILYDKKMHKLRI